MKTAFTYTVLGYVHGITTGEFVSMGVALYAPEAKYVTLPSHSTGTAKAEPHRPRPSFSNSSSKGVVAESEGRRTRTRTRRRVSVKSSDFHS